MKVSPNAMHSMPSDPLRLLPPPPKGKRYHFPYWPATDHVVLVDDKDETNATVPKTHADEAPDPLST